MGLVRGVVVAFAALFGVILGVVGFLVVGLFAVTPPDISPAAPGQPWDVSIEISDTFLTTQLNEVQQNSSSTVPIRLTDAKGVMRADGTVTITGNAGVGNTTVRLPNLAVPVTIVLRPTATDGKLTVAIVSSQLGVIPVPGNLGSLLEGPINDQIANALSGQPFTLTELTVSDGMLLVRAQQTP